MLIKPLSTTRFSMLRNTLNVCHFPLRLQVGIEDQIPSTHNMETHTLRKTTQGKSTTYGKRDQPVPQESNRC
jgi:hypothetical protein